MNYSYVIEKGDYNLELCGDGWSKKFMMIDE
jgi:hypothetical protein